MCRDLCSLLNPSARQSMPPAPQRRAAESLQSTFLSCDLILVSQKPQAGRRKVSLLGGCRAHRGACRDSQGGCTRGLGVETGALPQSRARMLRVQVDLGGGVGAAPLPGGTCAGQHTHNQDPRDPGGGECRGGPGGTRPWERRSATLSPSPPSPDLNVSTDVPPNQIPPA